MTEVIIMDVTDGQWPMTMQHESLWKLLTDGSSQWPWLAVGRTVPIIELWKALPLWQPEIEAYYYY